MSGLWLGHQRQSGADLLTLLSENLRLPVGALSFFLSITIGVGEIRCVAGGGDPPQEEKSDECLAK